MPEIEYDRPERFVVGTVGPPGGRTFFLQVEQRPALTSVSLEKQQVQVLAERLEELLAEVADDAPSAAALVDNGPLSTPIEDDFRVATLSLSWDADAARVLIEAFDTQVEIEPDAGGDGMVEVTPADSSVLRVALNVAQAREFVRRALATVAQGRPPCPFCGGPLDSDGHVCPRANGYKR
ncbi:DUF3090 domain-containing protein [Dermacoccaceae bacterium W4C1]